MSAKIVINPRKASSTIAVVASTVRPMCLSITASTVQVLAGRDAWVSKAADAPPNAR